MRFLRPDMLESGAVVRDSAHQDLRRRVCRAVQARFDGRSLYEAGKSQGFTKAEMREHWKRNKYRGRPILFEVTDQ